MNTYSVGFCLSAWVCVPRQPWMPSPQAGKSMGQGCDAADEAEVVCTLLVSVPVCHETFMFPTIKILICPWAAFHTRLESLGVLVDFASLVLSSVALLLPKLMHLTEILLEMIEKVGNLLVPLTYWRVCISRNMRDYKPTLCTLDQVAYNRSNCIFINEWVHFK